MDILQQELIRAKVLPEDYDFESHKKLVPMQPGGCSGDLCGYQRAGAGFRLQTAYQPADGLRRFAEWYYEFYVAKA